LKAAHALAAFAFVALATACRDVVGIHSITYTEGGSCTGATPTLVFSSTASYDALSAQGGFVFAGVTSAGIDRCPIAGCAVPSSIITVGSSVSFIDSTVTTNAIDYTLQGDGADGGTGGEIHSAALDGTSDTIAFATNAKYPEVVASSGTRIFWVDDEYTYGGTGNDAVDCIGCSAGDAPWITNLPGSAYGIVADANTVYVLADAASLTDLVVLGCSINTACGNSPRTVISGIDSSTEQTQIASDGTFFYIARENAAEVTRVDATGNKTPIVSSQDVIAIAVDATAGNLYYGTTGGVIGRVKSDGSTEPTALACNQDSVTAIAVDDQNVYFLAGSTTSSIYKLPK
jgi:hypothetical protein